MFPFYIPGECIPVGLREQPVGISSLFPSCRSDDQTQVALPTWSLSPAPLVSSVCPPFPSTLFVAVINRAVSTVLFLSSGYVYM